MASKYLLAKIKDRQIVFTAAEEKRQAADLDKANGKSVLVEIPDRYKIRTEKQNRYYRGVVIQLISEYTGYTNEEVHQDFSQHFLGYVKKGRKYRKSTTELNWKEMTDYIENIRAYVRESPALKTVVIPDPDPEYMYKNTDATKHRSRVSKTG